MASLTKASLRVKPTGDPWDGSVCRKAERQEGNRVHLQVALGEASNW